MTEYSDRIIEKLRSKFSGLRGIVTLAETEKIKNLLRELLDMDIGETDILKAEYYLNLERRFTIEEADSLAALHSIYITIRDKNVRVKDTRQNEM